MKTGGDVEQLQQRRPDIVGARAPRDWQDVEFDPGQAAAHTEAPGPAMHAAARVGRKSTVGDSDAGGRVGDRRDPGEVHPDSPMTDFAHRSDVRIEQTGLPEAPRCGEADRDPVARGTLEDIELRRTSENGLGSDRTLVAERIHRT